MKFAIPFLAALLAAGPVVAQSSDRNELVTFAPGASSKLIEDTITGYSAVNYIVGAKSGQTVTVSLMTDNDGSYFNVWAPNAETAQFIGTTSGNSSSFKAHYSGDYRIQVYLVRAAARRNERANYTLNISVK